MDLRLKCQTAELIEDTITRSGIKGRTQPFNWMASLFGPLFERRLPMSRMTRQEARAGGGILALLFPVMTILFVLALPIELLRSLRARRHNTKMAARLPALSEMSASGYRGAAERGGEVWRAQLRRARRVVAVDYRITLQGRATFLGSALVAITASDRELVWLNVFRSTPPDDATDGGRLLGMLAGASGVDVEQRFWEWQLRDPYELSDRPGRPW